MSFKLRIQNFGKLSDAEIRIRRFTVFAGPNNTGKSFVSKLLYSLFDAMNANHALVYLNTLLTPLRNNLSKLEGLGYKDEDPQLSVLNDAIEKMEDLVKSCSVDNLEEIGERLSKIFGYASELRERYENLEQDFEKRPLRRSSFLPPYMIEEVLRSIEASLNEIYKKTQEADAGQFVENGIRYKISENMIQNFQVSNLSLLRAEREKPFRVSIDGVGRFEFKESNLIAFNIEPTGFRQLQDYSQVIYLESPVYWKLKSALENLRISPRFLYTRGRKRLTGVPGYFYDLARLLREGYTADFNFEESDRRLQEIYKKLTSKEVVGGRLIISETGELSFQEGERSFPLNLTAMGVVNLGILALLIERNSLYEGAFLFIDEPEAHLHPSWQVKIAKTLLELSLLGVNVVIATHSADILKFLEVEVNKNPESKKIIALNHFSSGGVKDYGDDFDLKMAAIMEELTEPFSKLYLEGL